MLRFYLTQPRFVTLIQPPPLASYAPVGPPYNLPCRCLCVKNTVESASNIHVGPHEDFQIDHIFGASGSQKLSQSIHVMVGNVRIPAAAAAFSRLWQRRGDPPQTHRQYPRQHPRRPPTCTCAVLILKDPRWLAVSRRDAQSTEVRRFIHSNEETICLAGGETNTRAPAQE